MPEPSIAVTPSHVALRGLSYPRHKASGQAVVTLAGRDVYLGAHGTATSKAEYGRRIAEYLASSGAPPAALRVAAWGLRSHPTIVATELCPISLCTSATSAPASSMSPAKARRRSWG